MRRLSFVILVLGCLSSAVYAIQDRDNSIAGGLVVSGDLNHRVVIPQIVYFRVGSATFGEVDKVTIDLNDSSGFTAGNNTNYTGANPLGNSVPVAASNNGIIAVDVRGNVGDIAITYEVDNILGLSDGAGHFIPFDEIDTLSSDAANLPAPALDNNGGSAGANITVIVPGNLFGGRVVNRQANWTYSYKNTITPVAGTYLGSIAYTASVP